jgi:hypothetical protein
VPGNPPGGDDAAPNSQLDATLGAPDATVGAPDAATLDAMPVPPDAAILTAAFRDGVNGYAGTVDTYLLSAYPDANRTTTSSLRTISYSDVDALSSASTALVRFDDIVGAGAGQVPQGSTVVSAILTLELLNASSTAGKIHEVVVDWAETATWSNFGADPGVQVDDYGELVGDIPTTTGSHEIPVVASLSKWVVNPAENRGWIFLPEALDLTELASREQGTVEIRPKLTVEYIEP